MMNVNVSLKRCCGKEMLDVTDIFSLVFNQILLIETFRTVGMIHSRVCLNF